MPDDQSNIPTRPIPPPEPAADGITPSIAELMLGLGRSQAAGGRWEPPSPEELQRDFPLYEIRGILGRGRMGAVYKAWQKSLDRFVAIKILPPGLDGGDVDFAARFKREAKSMARLRHPGIVAVFDAGATATGLLYFIMECIEGSDVQKLITERGRLDPAEALRITAAVCDALGYAHDHAVIHRDIKPSNIMLDADGTVKVADFGLAKSTAPETTLLTVSNVTMGTPDFMAPESCVGAANVDHRADLYAVGVMLYQMLTGRLPRGKYDPPSGVVPGLDKALDRIVDRALQPEREKRYSSAVEFKTALQPVLTRSIAKSKAAAASRASRAGKKPPLLIAAALVVATLGIVLWFAFGKKGPQLTEAERAANEQVGAGAPRTLPSPGAPETRDGARVPPVPAPLVADANQFPPGQWVKVFAKFEQLPDSLKQYGPSVLSADGWLEGVGRFTTIDGLRVGNAAIRCTVKETRNISSSGFAAILHARYQTNDWAYALRLRPDGRVELFYTPDPQANPDARSPRNLQTTKVTLSPDQPILLELTVIGTRLLARCNGELIASVTDDALSRGALRIASSNPMRDIEVINLDGLPEAEAMKLAGVDAGSTSAASPVARAGGDAPPPPLGRWVKLFATAEDLPAKDRAKFTVDASGTWFTPASSLPGFQLPQASGRDGGLRAVFRRAAVKSSMLQLRR